MSMDSVMETSSGGEGVSPPPPPPPPPPPKTTAASPPVVPPPPMPIGVSPPLSLTLHTASPSSASPSPPAPPITSAPLPTSMTRPMMIGLGLHQPDMPHPHHLERTSYASPPPIPTTDPTANECKLVDYRGQKVAAFIIGGETMLCLPQAFELFLKHLVGGLHTVYTKLKRLDIVPLVCNVEQVRILRGLGAIQPGVNRCKLLSCKDFDVLYKDCTTASSRPGRPPKRASVGLSMPPTQLNPLKKPRLENGEYPGYENGHLANTPRMEKSPLLANGYNHPPTHLNPMQFMPLNHPAAAHTAILSPGGIPISSSHTMARSDGSIIKTQGLESMDAIARSGLWENCRAAYEDIVKHLERLREERGEAERALALDKKARDLSSHNGASNGPSPVLNLSKSGPGGGGHEHSGSEAGHTGPEDDEDDDNVSDVDEDDEKDQDLSDSPDVGNNLGNCDRTPGSQQAAALNYSTLVGASGDPTVAISSTETLLRNIQGLLKVAADNARQQERQINYEKAELKMEILREREVRENLEKQLIEEQKIRVLYQKRLRKEKKARRRLQDQLEMEMKRRTQYEEALKSTSADTLRMLNETLAQELEMERKSRQQQQETDVKPSLQEAASTGYYKNSVLFTSAT